MIRYARRYVLLMTLILTLASVGYSQTSTNSTPTTRAELITKCEQAKDEVVASRLLIKDYQVSILSYENALGKAEETGNLSASEIDALKVEVGQVREALASERTSLVLKEKEAKTYQKALAKMTKSRNFYRKVTKVLVVVTTISVAIAATVILKE